MTAESSLEITTGDGPMPTFVARPDTEPKGGILVVQEAFGVTTHIQDIARRLADAGWYAAAPAFFHRQGAPVMAYDDFDAVMPAMGALTAEGISMDLLAGLDHLENEGFPSARSGVIGFCMGGSVTFYAATLRPLGAAITFYGGGITQGRFGLPSLVDQAPHLRTPWLGLFGDLDQGIPVEDVEALRRATDQATPLSEIVRYPDATHGFNCNDRPDAYNAERAADAWNRTLAFLARHIAHRG